jgi:pyridoxamine-phosphate oxidase
MSDTESIEQRPWLTSGDFTEADEPFRLFADWLAEATKSEPRDPNAMALATVDEDGLPDVRMVLLKGFDADGFVFFTNLESNKGRQLAAHPKAALVFHWKSLNRQVRVRGGVTPVSTQEADEYFATRPRGAQIGAWASSQSRPLESTGPASASHRTSSSSGTIARSGCTTGSASSTTAAAGPRRACIHRRRRAALLQPRRTQPRCPRGIPTSRGARCFSPAPAAASAMRP